MSFDDEAGVRTQLRIWGWCLTGAPADAAARAAEYVHPDLRELLTVDWDVRGRTAGTPWWWGLYWLGEHVRRLGLEAEVLT